MPLGGCSGVGAGSRLTDHRHAVPARSVLYEPAVGHVLLSCLKCCLNADCNKEIDPSSYRAPSQKIRPSGLSCWVQPQPVDYFLSAVSSAEPAPRRFCCSISASANPRVQTINTPQPSLTPAYCGGASDARG